MNTKHLYQYAALLPMKRNSQRVKNKNFKLFAGKPLFYWVLEKLIVAPQIDVVVINSDAREVLEKFDIISNEKVILIDRPGDLCGDKISMNLILQHDLKTVSSKHYLMTHTTNPLLSLETIGSAIHQYEDALDNGFDSLFSVNRHQTRFFDKHGQPMNHDPSVLIQTQDLEPWFEENSNLYLFNQQSFSKTKARIGKKPKMMTTPIMESSDIDTPEDWEIAEIMFKHHRKKGLIK